MDKLIDLQALKDFGDAKDAKYSAEFAPINSVGSVYHFKGSVTDYAGLPLANNEIGDVYNILNADTARNIKAGDNVAWDGATWDNLSGVADMSAYVLKETGKGLSSYDYTFAEKTKLAGIANNANVNVIESIKLNGVELQVGIDKSVDIQMATGGGGTAGVTSINGQSGVVTLNIPTKTSELLNDNGFVDNTALNAQVANMATKAEVTALTAGTVAVAKATGDGAGNNIATTYATKAELNQAVIAGGGTAGTDKSGNDIETTYSTKAELQALKTEVDNLALTAGTGTDKSGNDIETTYAKTADIATMQQTITGQATTIAQLQQAITQLQTDLTANTQADAVRQQQVDDVQQTQADTATDLDITKLF